MLAQGIGEGSPLPTCVLALRVSRGPGVGTCPGYRDSLARFPLLRARPFMPHTRSRAEAQAREVRHEARRSLPPTVPAQTPHVALWSLEVLRAVLITTDHTWLRQALLRLRQRATDNEVLDERHD